MGGQTTDRPRKDHIRRRTCVASPGSWWSPTAPAAAIRLWRGSPPATAGERFATVCAGVADALKRPYSVIRRSAAGMEARVVGREGVPEARVSQGVAGRYWAYGVTRRWPGPACQGPQGAAALRSQRRAVPAEELVPGRVDRRGRLAAASATASARFSHARGEVPGEARRLGAYCALVAREASKHA